MINKDVITHKTKHTLLSWKLTHTYLGIWRGNNSGNCTAIAIAIPIKNARPSIADKSGLVGIYRILVFVSFQSKYYIFFATLRYLVLR